ncbi:ABC transporter substrate-binding protein [Alphaproteobacteria bacterium 46_93_T64]|nr:ABC transporter substrate-binding protein [Alphaproteobacteria bacterium 46_93_T64]
MLLRPIRYLIYLLAALSLFASSSALAASGKLVLYTSQLPEDAERTIQAFSKHSPDIQVSWLRNGTSKVMSLLQEEIALGDPKPDVILIADSMNMQWLKQRGHLWAYTEAPVKGFPDSIVDPDWTYFGTKFITTLIAYHTSAAKPVAWSDLLRSPARDQIIMPNPRYSGGATIHLGTLSMAPDLGWSFFEKLANNGGIAVRGNGNAIKSVVQGDKQYAIVVDFLARNYKRKGAPIDYVFPREGVSAITEPIAILKTAKNKEAAMAFVDFILSDEGQQLVSLQGMIPAKNGISPPAGFPSISKIKVIPSNIPQILKIDDRNKERFADLFGG